ncbi:GAF domain-containing protein [Dyadobacter flavalbus]|nr:GAF domain-containing protein [Dyadobacter flavalbus]
MPLRELERLQAVHRFLHLQINKEVEINNIVKLAAEICGTPTALVTLLDDQTQYIRFKFGFDKDETSQKDAFCSHTIQQPELMIVPDALMDPRFVDNPLVTSDPNIRFYAGAPLTTQDGHSLGSLCVIDQKPKELTEIQKSMLTILSKQVIQTLEFQMSIQILKEQFITAKNAEIKLRSFFESSNSCHLLFGKNMEVMAYNQTANTFFNKYFGISLSEGMCIKAYLHELHRESFLENFEYALSGKAVKSEKELAYADKTIYWYMTYEPAFAENSEVIGVSFNASDITERIKQEQLVIMQNKSLKEIAFIHSHELRRPVSSIMALMEIIKEEDYYTADKMELVMLDKAVEELDTKIREIVSFTS